MEGLERAEVEKELRGLGEGIEGEEGHEIRYK